MPLIRYTYGPDVREFGDQPIMVEELQARVLCDDKRRAVRVGPDELEHLPKADLLEVADDAGVDVKKSAPKKKIAQAVWGSEQS